MVFIRDFMAEVHGRDASLVANAYKQCQTIVPFLG